MPDIDNREQALRDSVVPASGTASVVTGSHQHDVLFLLERLDAERERSARLVRVVTQIEWGDETWPYCPACKRARWEGTRDGEHTYHCPIGAALRQEP